MPNKANILLVDDKPDKLLALEAVLGELGENLVTAHSGREALRHLLQQEFAVILLDVNMPGMDGFETASLIRQRRQSKDTPIIFVTAFADEMHVIRGYSLGAVDYILAPVVPDVLRTKVKVFVDLFRQKRTVQEHAEAQRHRAAQLQKLAAAAVSINSSKSLPALLKTVTDSAREIIDTHQAILLFLPAHGSSPQAARTEAVGSFSEKYSEWRDRPLRLDACAETQVARGPHAVRMTEPELHRHPDWEIVRSLEVPPIRGMLAAPLTSGAGHRLGVLYLADKCGGEFSEEDESILTQLAQMASVAIENTLFAEEREANRLKDEFLATLSHELRTPLNAILGWTQLLRADDVSPHDLTHGLEVIERNVKAQTRLIEDLLDVSRITTGKLRLNVRPMSLPAVVNGAVESARPAADAKGIRLESEVPEGIGELPGDSDRLQQVIWNLLSNAIKFTPAGGSVRVELASTANGAAVHVRDTGRGIHPSFLPYVFDRFRQADSSSTRSHGGLGLGLTIVKHLVEMHGGSVQAHSQGEGHGSTFTVELPERPASAPAPRVAQDNGKERPGRPVPERLPDVEGLHVLAVDDEPDARELIRHVLERARVRVTMASSAEEALGLIDRVSPDVLVSDIGMPGTDGYMFIRQVRQRTPDRSGTVPAIALTAYVREEDRQKMIAAGFTAHVPKPLDANELVRTVGHLSGRTLFRRPEPELKRA